MLLSTTHDIGDAQERVTMGTGGIRSVRPDTDIFPVGGRPFVSGNSVYG